MEIEINRYHQVMADSNCNVKTGMRPNYTNGSPRKITLQIFAIRTHRYLGQRGELWGSNLRFLYYIEFCESDEEILIGFGTGNVLFSGRNNLGDFGQKGICRAKALLFEEINHKSCIPYVKFKKAKTGSSIQKRQHLLRPIGPFSILTSKK